MQQRAGPRQRGYDTRWDKARLTYLAKHPLCVKCSARGITTAATVVDHIIPHKGDSALFWDTANWQALCKPCHDSDKQREEHGRGALGCDEDGIPLDRLHRWNAAPG